MNPETFKILAKYKSRSKPNKKKKGRDYTVTVSSRGPVQCSCPGFTYRQTCWHVEYWINRLSHTTAIPRI
jgi:hypothetical protein